MTQLLVKATNKFSETAIDDEVVVMNLDSGDFYSLTGTARAIWLLIDGSRDSTAITADLAVQHQCEPADIAPDVEAFLDQLGQAGLLVGH